MKKSILLLTALAAMSAPVFATEQDTNQQNVTEQSILDDMQFRVGGFSYHIGQRKFCPGEETNCPDTFTPFNEVNNSVGVRYKNVEIATMKNSYYQRSFILGYHFDTDVTDWMDVGVFVGAATGYEEEISGGVLPFVQPSVTFWAYDTVGVELGVLPSSTPVVTLSFKAKF